MSITLTHPTAGAGSTPLALALPVDLLWTDEFTWRRIQQSREYTSTGALVIEDWVKQTGRPITLQGGVDYAWCQRADLQTLNAWAGQGGLVLTLNLRGVDYQVAWDHESGALQAEPVVPYSDPLPDDPYSLTIKLMEVAP
jgi:hypothetical protein